MKQLQKDLQIKKIDQGLLFSRANRLGQGVFGQVYLGFNQLSGSIIAVKVVNLQKIVTHQNQQTLMKKIKDEIVNMQIAKHERIVQFQTAKTSARNIYIICEYCNGDNLDKFIHKRGYLTQTETLSFFRQILEGFYQLREKNIVHRDIKPANLLMHNYSIKIADLGFSKSTEGHEQLLESIVGTPYYMSPQIFQRQKYTEKTDIWSLGVIVYEMLYGHTPWTDCRNLLELKDKIKKDIAFPKYPFVTVRTKQLIRRMLRVQQNDRISWQALFKNYLAQSPTIKQQISQSCKPHYLINSEIINYFRNSYFIQSYIHLHRLLKQLNLANQQQICSLYHKYKSSQQFFTEVKFITTNKILMEDYYNYYLQKRNQMSFVLMLLQKINRLLFTFGDVEIQTYVVCIILLIFKLVKTLLQQIVNGVGELIPPKDPKYKQIIGKFPYDKFLSIILGKDILLIESQFYIFNNCFQQILRNLHEIHPNIYEMIVNDLSGIYSSKQGDLRVIKFFLSNYFKKIFNYLKESVIKRIPQNKTGYNKENSMISEDEQEQAACVPLQFTILRLIDEYLSNKRLFDLRIQQQNLKIPRISEFKRNLNQLLYDCETTMEQTFYIQLEQTEPLKEESVISFISKEIRWTPLLLPKLI